MNCLYCGKKITAKASAEEKDNLWHNSCVKIFFGTKEMPKLDVSEKQLEKLAGLAVSKGLTVAGVQKKLSLHLSSGENARLTIVNYPTGYILKPQTEDFEALPEFENLAMRLAEKAGIKTVPHALIKIEDEFAYITKRIDREIFENEVRMYAMEDFCQISNRLTEDKYKGSYEKCAGIIKDYSVHLGLDLSELFLRVLFSFIIGNSDLHLKNLSLIETQPAKREFYLSQAYDFLPVNIIMPEDKEQLALTLNGKKRNIGRKDFLSYGEKCAISEKTTKNILNKLCSLKVDFLDICNDSYLADEQKIKMKELIKERIAILDI
ncbi:MAG: HipA domain-containing protein [Anaerovoracaceae bacterium]